MEFIPSTLPEDLRLMHEIQQNDESDDSISNDSSGSLSLPQEETLMKAYALLGMKVTMSYLMFVYSLYILFTIINNLFGPSSLMSVMLSL
jgi:hypothetical protein